MELMSSLLLCVIVVLLPQTSGKSRGNRKFEIKFNNTLFIQQRPLSRKHILLNVNGMPLFSKHSGLQSIFIDFGCRRCHDCMERALKAFQKDSNMMLRRPSSEELHDDLLTNEIYRTKRDVLPTDQSMPDDATQADFKTTAKIKNKTYNRTRKTVSVTKYSMDENVYALRVQEQQILSEGTNDTKCQMYNIRKTYSCDSPESDSLLNVAKKKAYKRVAKKQEQDKIKQQQLSTTNTTTKKAKLVSSVFRKREVDNSQVPENFMPSIEEVY